jgi:lactate permease
MSNFVGPELVDIVASITAMIGLVLLFKVWQPKDQFVLAGEHQATVTLKSHGFSRTLLAWSPYLFLVAFVLVWGYPDTGAVLAKASRAIPWPGLHNQITRVPPVVATPSPYTAMYNFNWLAAAGTACAFATIASALTLRVSVGAYFGLLGKVAKQLGFSIFTIACVLGLAYLMNYSGMTTTLGLAFAATGTLFPFFSALLGWLGVFLTGSDTSANALFGNLQVVTANSLHLNPATMAASNSAGGVMGKMISLTSLAVAVAATGMERSEEGKLFRFTVKHSVFLASLLGILATIYAYA